MHFTTDAYDEFAIYTGQIKYQMMSCMLKLNCYSMASEVKLSS